jgi:hypothetical protein
MDPQIPQAKVAEWQLSAIQLAMLRPSVVVALLVALDATVLSPITSVRFRQDFDRQKHR